jgi:hypothetical protein
MQSLVRFAVAVALTLFVSAGFVLGLTAYLAWDGDALAPSGGVVLQSAGRSGTDAAPNESCRVTLRPGDDIGAAVARQPIDAVVCLTPGVHQPFNVTRSTSAGVVVLGDGPDTTVIDAQREDGVTVAGAERLTLVGLTIRGGTPAGIYATNTRGLMLRDLRIESADIGIHADEGATVTIENVTVDGSAEVGLLVRKRSTVEAGGLRVVDSHGMAVGVTEGATSLTLRGSEIGRPDLPVSSDAVVAIDAGGLTLESVAVHGGNPAGIYAARVPEVNLRDVQVEGATFGVHIDDRSAATLEDVTLVGSRNTGLLVRRGATVSGDRVRVIESTGTGVSAVANAGSVTLRDGEIEGAGGAGLFAGIAGCAELPAASLAVPDCFYSDLESFVSTSALLLERVTIRDTRGPGAAIFPGVQAELYDLTVSGAEMTGVFAWGASVSISGSMFDDNAEHALEFRSYPEPRGERVQPASGSIAGTTIRGTRPLPSGVLGGGIVAQGAELAVRDSLIERNADAGVSYQNGSRGVMLNSRVLNNAGIGVCIAPDSAVTAQTTLIAGNRIDGLNACG